MTHIDQTSDDQRIIEAWNIACKPGSICKPHSLYFMIQYTVGCCPAYYACCKCLGYPTRNDDYYDDMIMEYWLEHAVVTSEGLLFKLNGKLGTYLWAT